MHTDHPEIIGWISRLSIAADWKRHAAVEIQANLFWQSMEQSIQYGTDSLVWLVFPRPAVCHPGESSWNAH